MLTKCLLSLREIKITGRKQELVATALNAYEGNAPIVETAEEAEANIAAQNNLKLNEQPDRSYFRDQRLRKMFRNLIYKISNTFDVNSGCDQLPVNAVSICKHRPANSRFSLFM